VSSEHSIEVREAFRDRQTGTCALVTDLTGHLDAAPLMFGEGTDPVGTVDVVAGVAVATVDMSSKQGRAAFGAFKSRRVTRWTVHEGAVVVKNWAGAKAPAAVTHDDVMAWLIENGA